VASLLTSAPPSGSPAASLLAAPSAASFLLACPVPDDLFSGQALPGLAVPDTAAAEDSAPGDDAPGDDAPGGAGQNGAAANGAAQNGASRNGGSANGASQNGGAANGVDRTGLRPAGGDSAGLDADRAVTEIYGTQYCSLVRLAALLIGEVGAAEEVVQASFVDMHSAWSRLRDTETAVSFLRQAVVSRSRWILPHHARLHPARRHSAMDPALGGSVLRDPTLPPSARPCPAAAAENAAIRAIRELPMGQREALVLRLYLDLPEEQIATAMRTSQRAVQDHTSSGMAALRAVL
jgi:DNA-directed RNA polymerase specialized sigma24 family protein